MSLWHSEPDVERPAGPRIGLEDDLVKVPLPRRKRPIVLLLCVLPVCVAHGDSLAGLRPTHQDELPRGETRCGAVGVAGRSPDRPA